MGSHILAGLVWPDLAYKACALPDEEHNETPPADGPDDEQRDEQSAEGGDRQPLFKRVLTDLIDSGKRGPQLVNDVAVGTKEELVRIISGEFRGFLDKMDVVDLVQEVFSGMTVDISAQIKFSRDSEGRLQPEVKKNEGRIRGGRRRKAEEDKRKAEEDKNAERDASPAPEKDSDESSD